MRSGSVVLLFVLVAMSGCFSGGGGNGGSEVPDPADVGHDPTTIDVTGHRKESITVESFDGTTLDTLVYIPQTADLLPNGSAPRWPVVVFLHGFGFFKEQFEGFEAIAPGADADRGEVPAQVADEAPEELTNVLARYADNGFLAVAYDARGHGRSTGSMTIAGPAEMADLDAVLDEILLRYDASDRIGVTGVSYGAGQALLALVENPRVDTAVPMYGWIDLYDALVTNNVPKLAWGQTLFALATTTGQGTSPLVTDWYRQTVLREELARVEAEMDARSTRGRLAENDKPLFVCQGLQESLFPQADEIWQEHGGFTRAYVYTGGHELMDPGCVDRGLAWFQHFLGGFDSGVASWPALETQDAAGTRAVGYPQFPETEERTWYLRTPDLAGAANDRVTFTIEHRGAQNPLVPPAVIGDPLGPGAAPPTPLAQDPNAVFFATPALEGPAVLLGAATLRLDLEEDNQTGWQVAAQLVHESEGRSRVLARTAYAALEDAHVENGTVELRFHFTKADLAAGDKLVLKLAANDASWWMPLQQPYAVGFTGASSLEVPFFTG